MLIVNLIGGLGNQMFQHAFGLVLKNRFKTQEVYYDIRELSDKTPRENFTIRDFELDIFQGKVAIASPEQLSWFFPASNSLSDRVISKVKRLLVTPIIYNEPFYYKYDDNIWSLKGNIYFNGYWQVAKYFEEYQQQLKEAFVFIVPPNTYNAELIERIGNSNSISVHIRRGDYVSNSLSNQVHGTCSPSYYKAAIKHIAFSVKNPTLFVFSDDHEWVKANLAFDYPVVHVEGNTGKNSYEDMRLMSLCKHNIIANSSFSWWGAWLNVNPSKVVVAPNQWMQLSSINSDDLIPKSWIRI